MKYSIIFSLSILFMAIVISKSFNYFHAGEQTRYDKLVNKEKGFEERAEVAGIENAEKAEMTRPSNSDEKDKIKSVEDMTNYIKDKDLKDGAKYLEKELLTYEDFLNKYTEFSLNPSISQDRMVWVIQTYFPNGLDTDNGRVKNAVSTVFYDAETGESIGYSVKSIDSKGSSNESEPLNRRD